MLYLLGMMTSFMSIFVYMLVSGNYYKNAQGKEDFCIAKPTPVSGAIYGLLLGFTLAFLFYAFNSGKLLSSMFFYKLNLLIIICGLTGYFFRVFYKKPFLIRFKKVSDEIEKPSRITKSSIRNNIDRKTIK